VGTYEYSLAFGLVDAYVLSKVFFLSLFVHILGEYVDSS